MGFSSKQTPRRLILRGQREQQTEGFGETGERTHKGLTMELWKDLELHNCQKNFRVTALEEGGKGICLGYWSHTEGSYPELSGFWPLTAQVQPERRRPWARDTESPWNAGGKVLAACPDSPQQIQITEATCLPRGTKVFCKLPPLVMCRPHMWSLCPWVFKVGTFVVKGNGTVRYCGTLNSGD